MGIVSAYVLGAGIGLGIGAVEFRKQQGYMSARNMAIAVTIAWTLIVGGAAGVAVEVFDAVIR